MGIEFRTLMGMFCTTEIRPRTQITHPEPANPRQTQPKLSLFSVHTCWTSLQKPSWNLNSDCILQEGIPALLTLVLDGFCKPKWL